ncbi:MAG: hypothetical protein ABIJ41_02475 [Candidatus Omnitrophota bacterium]
MKDKILILTAVLSIGCLVFAVKASQTVQQNEQALSSERLKRFTAEEELQKSQTRIASFENELISVRNQVQGIQAILEKEKIASGNLRKEYEKVIKLKDILEDELKDALVPEPLQEEAAP